MPQPQQTRIFISYARKDGAELAQRLQGDLTKHGFDAWLDTQRLSGGVPWSLTIEQEINTRDVTVALLTPGSYVSEICRAEQLRTLRKGKRLIPVLASAKADRPLYLEEPQYRDFSDLRRYDERFQQLLADIRGDVTAGLREQYRVTPVNYLTAPPRVANYLERPEALHALRDTLFAEDHRQPIALTALAGMGGIGKTVLAKALTEDEVVQQAFPDGIVWITAGKEHNRDLVEEMREVAKALGDDAKLYENRLACENQYRTLIASKAALVVVDDVWTKTDIEPLLAESPRSRFLFTTRDAGIGRFVGAHEHQADLLDVPQSRKLLALWADLPVAQLPAEADEIIRQCGRLPLALSVIGPMLRGTDATFWGDTLHLLRKADVSGIEDQLPKGQQSFFKAVEVSFQSLKPEMQERYRGLAVLLEDMAAPLQILETLWDVSEADARRISRQFADRSLAQAEGTSEAIRLHDLQLDYVRSQYTDKEALQLIHGAIRLSLNVIAKDPGQFASQVVGRLLPHNDMPAIRRFITEIAGSTRVPWLRPLQATLHPSGTALVRSLTGHTGAVRAVAMTPDGRLAVSASEDKTLKIWDLGSGFELRTLAGHTGAVGAVAATPDGRLAVSASDDRTLKVWDVASGRKLRTLKGSEGRRLKVWDVASERTLRTLKRSGGRPLKVRQGASGRKLRTLEGHTGAVNGVALSGDGRLAVSASTDHTLKVWDVASGRMLRTLEGHTRSVTSVTVTAEGRLAVSVSEDQTVRVWELGTGCELRSFRGHPQAISAVAVTPDGRLAVSAAGVSYTSEDDHTSQNELGDLLNQLDMRVWDLESRRRLRRLRGHTDSVCGLALSADGRLAVSASRDKTLKVWHTQEGRELRALESHSTAVIDVAVSEDGRLAVSVPILQKRLKVWDVASGHMLRTLAPADDSGSTAVAVTADGRLAVSASEGETLKVWDVESGRELRTLKGHTGVVNGVALSKDGRLAVSASTDHTLKVWDVASGRRLRTIKGHTEKVNGVAMTGDGRLAISRSDDNTLKVWDLETGRELHTFKAYIPTDLTGLGLPLTGLALSNDGRLAVSASTDHTLTEHTLTVWDVASGREFRTLEGHTHVVYGLALSRNGRLAISASWDRTIKVWEVASGAVLATFTCDGPVFRCAWADESRLIVAGDAGGHIHLLRLEEPKREK